MIERLAIGRLEEPILPAPAFSDQPSAFTIHNPEPITQNPDLTIHNSQFIISPPSTGTKVPCLHAPPVLYQPAASARPVASKAIPAAPMQSQQAGSTTADIAGKSNRKFGSAGLFLNSAAFDFDSFKESTADLKRRGPHNRLAKRPVLGPQRLHASEKWIGYDPFPEVPQVPEL